MSAINQQNVAFPYPDHAAKLAALARHDREQSINKLLEQEPERLANFSCHAAGWQLDFCRHLLSDESRLALLSLAEASGVLQAREALFDGSELNNTEQRAVLHTLLRANQAGAGLESEFAAVQASLEKVSALVERLHAGEQHGWTGKPITDVVNIAIGGPDLGPRMATEALTPFHQPGCRVHFCANVDPDDLNSTLTSLNPETTLFIVNSKSFSTEETLQNAESANRWLINAGAKPNDVAKHFVAVTANTARAEAFGMSADSVVPMWDWVGGRFSLWSGAGLSIAFAIGMKNFRELLAGAASMDQHFRETDAATNLPLWLSLLEIWYVNFMGAQSHAVVPYHQHLSWLPNYLQQLSMESNGKSVNRNGEPIDYATAPVVWGGVGSNSQHSFHQWLHQGTALCPVDFILVTEDQTQTGNDGKQRLLANGLAQVQALMTGRDLSEARSSLLERGLNDEQAQALAPHLAMPGNRPSSVLSCAQLTPHALGALLALYEHKIFCNGHIWQINAFDQWGVEIGKHLSADIYQELSADRASQRDRSSAA